MKLTRVNRCKGAEDYWGREEIICMNMGEVQWIAEGGDGLWSILGSYEAFARQ